MMYNCQTFYSPESDPVRMSVELSNYFNHLMEYILSQETPPTSPEIEQETRRTRRKIEWTQDEDENLKRLLTKYGRRWATIVKQIPNKTIASCRTRASALHLEGKLRRKAQLSLLRILRYAKQQDLDNEFSFRLPTYNLNLDGKKQKLEKMRRLWSTAEDNLLNDLVQTHGTNNWKLFASKMRQFERNPTQCRQRWNDHLSNANQHGTWTPEEDQKILEGFKLYGKSWTKIAMLVPGRGYHAVRNRLRSSKVKKMIAGLTEEDYL